MNADELKALSDKTFFDNDKGLINPAEHRRFNNETVDFIQDAYYATFVVDSTEKLAFWAQNAPGHDYTHVLIKPGIYTSSVGIKLKDTGTKTVVGMGGNLISFALPTTTMTGITGYGSEYNDSYIMGVNIQVAGKVANGFGSCCNLIRCMATVKSESSSLAHAAFSNCQFLSHCSGFDTSTTGTVIYSYCNYLTNCYAKTSMVTPDQDSYCFRNCQNCQNCQAEATAERLALGFFLCSNLTNCTGNAQSENAGAAGFDNCKKITTCSGSGICSGSGYGHGFSNCKGMFMCSPSGENKSGVYGSCYMRPDGTQPVGETAEGGYNWLK